MRVLKETALHWFYYEETHYRKKPKEPLAPSELASIVIVGFLIAMALRILAQ